MVMFRCGNGGGAKVLYAGDVSVKGDKGSSGSSYTTGSVFVGKGLSNVKCAATLKNCKTIGWSGTGHWYGSCNYNSNTGYVKISFGGDNGFKWYNWGEGTAYVLVVQEK